MEEDGGAPRGVDDVLDVVSAVREGGFGDLGIGGRVHG